jgi:hypothetical protein
MALSSHVNADELMKAAEDHPHLSLLKRAGGGSKRHAFHTSHYGRYQCVAVLCCWLLLLLGSHSRSPSQN